MPKPHAIAFADIRAGMSAEFTETITPAMVERFARLSGDFNPLHMDEAYASGTPVGARIPHGMLAGALCSRLVGMYLPGLHSLYLSQNLTFHRPLPWGRVVVRGEVTAVHVSTRTVGIAVSVTDGKDMLVKGEALVKMLQ